MTARAALLLAGLALLGVGAAVDLAAGAGRRWIRPAPYAVAAAASACLLAAGVLSVVGPPVTLDLGNLLAFGRTSARLDGLAGLFLTITSGLGVLVSACLASWARPAGRLRGHGVGAGYALLLGSVAVVIVAGDAFTFLFAWETLSVAFYVLTAVTRARPGQPRASWMTLAVGKAGGASVLLGFLLLAGRAHSVTFSSWSAVPLGPLHAAAYVLVVAGFGAKVGLAPFQVWMPAGYPEAPGPVRAAMAGVAVNAGFYGLWRMLGVLGAPPTGLAIAVLVLGGLTGLLGIAFAAVQSDLNRVIAYSSVENSGMILVGYGMALAGAATNHVSLIAVGLLAATLQVVAHGTAKSALFSAAANFPTTRLEDLSGTRRSQPWSSAAFAASSLTLAGMPVTIGFVSEWFLLESLMQQFRVPGLGLHLAMALSGALVALTAGVAALAFVRVLGLVVLRRPSPASSGRGREPGAIGRGVLAGLGALCFGLALATPWVIRYIALGLSPIVPASVIRHALRSPWVVQPVYAGFSSLSPTWLFVVFPAGILVVLGATVLASSGRFLRVRRVPAWRSATAGVAGPDSYSAFGYANVLRHVLGNVLGARRTVVATGDRAGGGAGSGGVPAQTAAGERPPADHAHLSHQARAVEPVETYLYRPIGRAYLRLVSWARRLQSGRLEAYVAYMLAALIAVLIVAATVH